MAGESLVVANESFYKVWVDSAVEEGHHLLFSVLFCFFFKSQNVFWDDLYCSPTDLALIV